MQRVGGFESYLALCEDARAYDDVLLTLLGESDARRVQALEAKLGG